MSRSPFTTAELRALPRKAYAYRNRHGIWGICTPAETVETVVANGNSEELTASDYYAEPTASFLTSTRHEIATQADRAYDSAGYWA
jgi:hypothetical protein